MIPKGPWHFKKTGGPEEPREPSHEQAQRVFRSRPSRHLPNGPRRPRGATRASALGAPATGAGRS
jgi:hypothetical protein